MFSIVKVRDSAPTGYLFPARDGLGVAADGQTCWGATAAIAAARLHLLAPTARRLPDLRQGIPTVQIWALTQDEVREYAVGPPIMNFEVQ